MKRCVLDGSRLASMDAVYHALGEAFSFPQYFGNNPDALWDALGDYSGEPGLDPGGGIEQRLVAEARADELDAERQAVRPRAGGQCHARGPGQGPDRVEVWSAGRFETLRRFTRCARGQQDVDIVEDVVEMRAERLGSLDRLDIVGERQLPPRRQQGVAQDLAHLV